MDEAPELLARLDRIERLRSAGEPRRVILAEIRELLAEGEAALGEPDASAPRLGLEPPRGNAAGEPPHR